MGERQYEWTAGPEMTAGLGGKVSGSVRVSFNDGHRANVQTTRETGFITVREREYNVNIHFKLVDGAWTATNVSITHASMSDYGKPVGATFVRAIIEECLQVVADLAQPNVLATAQRAYVVSALSRLEDELAVHADMVKRVKASMRALVKELGA